MDPEATRLEEVTPTPPSSDRRRFLGVCAAFGLAGTGFPEALLAQAQQAPESPITAEMIASAADVAGLEFSDDEREMMRASLARNSEAYEAIRQIEIPNGVAPALLFEPDLPGVGAPIPEGTDRVVASTPAASSRPADDDLAFAGIARLARLIATRQVSATELTELYLARLERYDPELMFQVNATADRARQQAAVADRELAAGDSRGPLHGIPWGRRTSSRSRDIRQRGVRRPIEINTSRAMRPWCSDWTTPARSWWRS